MYQQKVMSNGELDSFALASSLNSMIDVKILFELVEISYKVVFFLSAADFCPNYL